MTEIPGTVTTDTVETSVASSEQTIRSVRRSLGTGVFLMASLTILLPLFGFGPKGRMDNVVPGVWYLVVGIILVAELVVVAICSLASKRAPEALFKAFRKVEPFTPAGDGAHDILLMRYDQAYGFKAVLEMACLLGLQGFASILYSITANYWTMANLAMVVGLVVVFLPTRDKMERWARPRAEAAWHRANPVG